MFAKLKTLIMVAACCTALHSVAFAAEPFGLKGLQIGQPVSKTEIEPALGFHCDSTNCAYDGRCSCGWGLTSIAGANADISVMLDHGRLVKITASFAPIEFEAIASAFTTKYGKPSHVDRANAQTVAGAKLNMVIDTWENPQGDQIVLANFADGAHGILNISTKGERDFLEALKAKQGAI